MLQKTELSIEAAVNKLNSALLGSAFRLLIRRGKKKNLNVLKFVGRQNAIHTQWFLHAADQFIPDQERTDLNEDHETFSPNVHLHRSASNTFRKERDTTRQSSYRYPESFHQQKEELKRQENLNKQWQTFSKGSIPLWAAEQSNISDQESEEEVVNRMRERKTRRDEFKSKFIEGQKSGTFKQDIKIEPHFIKSKKKGDKFQNAQHYIDMEIQIKQPENASNTARLKRTHRKYMSSDDKFNTKNKTFIPGFALARQKYEILKPEERVFILQIPNQMKLTSGVSHRETSQRINNIDTFCLSNPTKKKLQFLKNNQLNPCKIKLSELISYKKLGTMTNLAYCSSMKTVKDIGKEPAESKISIDSRQLIDQPGSSKKLIRIANRRIFQELMFEGNQQNSAEIGWKKSRVKLKKQNKVRFDNIVVN